jgi:TetR/AcrR family transcriptional repressor of mexJK operon
MASSMTQPAAAPTPPLSGDEAARKERQILDGAAFVFARDGYEGASMSRIAGEAGVSKGTLYNYFTSKAELFSAYVRRECGRSIAMMFDDFDPSAPPSEALSQIGVRMFRMLLSETALTMYRMVVAEAEKFPELASSFYAEGPARSVAHLAAYLRGAATDGMLRLDDPEFAAEQFFALIQTHLCMKRRLRLIEMPSQAELEHVIGQAVRMFLSTYGVARN